MHDTLEFEVRWADCDMNYHMRHSSYYDYAAHLRTRYFFLNGYSLEKLREMGFGPVLLREECVFLRELHLNDKCTIEMLISGESKDKRLFQFTHLFKKDGKLMAVSKADVAWIDIKSRHIVEPPKEILDHFHKLPKADDFVEMHFNHK